MTQRGAPEWFKLGPVAAVLVVLVFVVGYAGVGVLAHFSGVRPPPPDDNTSPAIETPKGGASGAETPASESPSGESSLSGLCAEWLSNPAVVDLGYYAQSDYGLANLEPLRPTPAPRAWTIGAFGQPCDGSDLWLARVGLPPGWTGRSELSLPTIEGVQFTLPDGRNVLLNPTLTGNYASASFVASIVSSEGQPLSPAVLMQTGQNRGFHGRLFTPPRQPLGGFHVWLEAGGTWQGHSISWVGVTDFAGSTPLNVGVFPTSYSCPAGQCDEFELTSVEYSSNGPDDVTLTWSRQGAQPLSATYTLAGGEYRLRSGRPPNHE